MHSKTEKCARTQCSTLILPHHGSGAAVLSSCVFLLLSSLGLGNRQGSVSTETHTVTRHGGGTDGAYVRATSPAQPAVGESVANVPTESGDAERQQSQAQMETQTNLGAAQVAKTTYDTRDCQTTAFSKMKGFKSDEKARPDWRYKFRVEASRCFKQAAAILDWPEDRYDQPKLPQVRIGLIWPISTCSSMEIWFLSWKSAPKSLRLCATPRRKLCWMPGEG